MRVLIDGQEVERAAVMCLHQWDPYPGGHTFEVRISDAEARADRDVLAHVGRAPTSASNSNSLMLWLQSLVEALDDTLIEWVLNRVTGIYRCDDGLVVTGDASPRVRHRQ